MRKHNLISARANLASCKYITASLHSACHHRRCRSCYYSRLRLASSACRGSGRRGCRRHRHNGRRPGGAYRQQHGRGRPPMPPRRISPATLSPIAAMLRARMCRAALQRASPRHRRHLRRLALTVSISTTAAIVAAVAGCRVANSDNRGASSKSGSADVLEFLGVALGDGYDALLVRCVDNAGNSFVFGRNHHPHSRPSPRRDATSGCAPTLMCSPLGAPCSRAVHYARRLLARPRLVHCAGARRPRCGARLGASTTTLWSLMCAMGRPLATSGLRIRAWMASHGVQLRTSWVAMPNTMRWLSARCAVVTGRLPTPFCSMPVRVVSCRVSKRRWMVVCVGREWKLEMARRERDAAGVC